MTRDIFKSGNMLYGLSGWQANTQQAIRNDFEGLFGDQAGLKYMELMTQVESLSRSLQDDGNGGFIVPSDTIPALTQPDDTLPQTPVGVDDYADTPAVPLSPLPTSTSSGTSGGSGSTGGSATSQVGSQLTTGQQAVDQALQAANSQANQVLGWQSFFLGIQASRFQNEVDAQMNALLLNNQAGNAGENLDSLLSSINTGAINLGQYNQTQDRYSTADLRRKRNKVDYDATQTFDGSIPQGVSSKPTLIGI